MTVELALAGVRAGYGPVEVLHGVSLEIPAGALTALLGPNGAGKTTLLSVVAGLVPLRGGSLVWHGEPIDGLDPHRRARAGMTLIPARSGVFPDLTVRDNLEVFAGTTQRWDAAYDAFPFLRKRLDQPAGSLSGGEQQMLAMSRPLLRRPRLLLLDETSFGLAPRITRQLFDVIAELARQGTTVVMVEQHLSDALRLADVVYVLARGEIGFAGEPDELVGRAIPGYVSL